MSKNLIYKINANLQGRGLTIACCWLLVRILIYYLMFQKVNLLFEKSYDKLYFWGFVLVEVKAKLHKAEQRQVYKKEQARSGKKIEWLDWSKCTWSSQLLLRQWWERPEKDSVKWDLNPDASVVHYQLSYQALAISSTGSQQCTSMADLNPHSGLSPCCLSCAEKITNWEDDTYSMRFLLSGS